MTKITGTAPAKTCSVCGREFPCCSFGGESVCWCFYFPSVDCSPLQKDGITTCVCPVCLQEIAIRQGHDEESLPSVTFTGTNWIMDL